MVIGKGEIKSKTSVYDNYDVHDFWRMFTEDPSLSINNQSTALNEMKKRFNHSGNESLYHVFLVKCVEWMVYGEGKQPKVNLNKFVLVGKSETEKVESLLDNFGCYDVENSFECGAVLY